VHGGADAVAHVVAHHLEPGALGHPLHRGAHVAQPVAADQLGDAGVERGPGDVDQALVGSRDRSHPGGERGVAVVAVHDGAAVDRDDVALLERLAVGDAVHHHVVAAGADHGRVAVVAEEVRPGAPAGQHLAADPVQVEERHPGAQRGADGRVHLGHHPPGPPHGADLGGRPAPGRRRGGPPPH
jgi:hypothetical protein